MGFFAIIFYVASAIVILAAILVLVSFFLKSLAAHRGKLYNVVQISLIFSVVIFVFAIATKDPLDIGIPFEVSGSTAIVIWAVWVTFQIRSLENKISEIKDDFKELKREFKGTSNEYNKWHSR